MAKSSANPRPQLISLPIFWQVMGLSLTVLVLSVGINIWWVIDAPQPPPSGYRMTEAVEALKSGQVKLQDGHLLRAETTTEAPDYVKSNPDHRSRQWAFQMLVAARLASDLGVPTDSVWINFRPLHHSPPWHRHDHFGDDGGFFPGPGDHAPGDRGPDHRDYDGPAGPGAPGQGPAPGMGTPGPGQPNMGRPTDQGGGSAGGSASSQDANGERPEAGFGRERDQALRFMQAEERGRTEILYPAFSAAWKLPNGTYRIINPPKTWIEPWQERLLMGFGLSVLLILPLAWLLSRRLSRPIVAFSEAAARVSFEDNSPPVLAVGPREVRAAADVLNAMQDRIKKQVESRTALMGAIAHDLKTPLARMRLRIEGLPEPTRDKLAEDIAHMDALIRSAMSFTSAPSLRDNLRPLDLSALVETLADDLAVTCKMETPQIEDHVEVAGDTVALKRIITNLVENACRYAGTCRVELRAHGKEAELCVIDPGPGLPSDMLETVFEPFYRMESSRNRDTGGSGLGLSVARALAEAQGGTLRLINRYDGQKVVGLEARLTLPRLVK